MPQPNKELYEEAYGDFYTAALDDLDIRARSERISVSEEFGDKLPHHVLDVELRYDSELLTEDEIASVYSAQTEATTRARDQHAMAEIVLRSIEHQGAVNDMLLEEFVVAWRKEKSEEDGHRSYAPRKLAKNALALGISQALIDALSTHAESIVAREKAEEESNL